MITDRDQEFRATVLALYLQELGRPIEAVSHAELEAWVQHCREGMTGEQLRTLFHDSPEGIAFREKPPEPVKPVPSAAARVHVDGLGFVTEAGVRWTWAMMSGFRDYQRFLAGEDIRPLLEQARELGANGRRVLLMFAWGDGAGPLRPQDHPDFYARLGPFCALMADYGQYVQATVFADTRLVMPDAAQQQEHFRRVCDQLRPWPNVFVELVNENDANDNRVDIGRFSKPDGITSSAGSNGAGSNPPGPYWDYADLHAERRDNRIALTTTTVFFAIHGYSEGADSFAGTQRATVNSEPYGFDEETQPGRRTNDPETAYLMGVGCAYGAGGTAHTTDGIQSVILRPRQAECTRRFLDGVKQQ